MAKKTNWILLTLSATLALSACTRGGVSVEKTQLTEDTKFFEVEKPSVTVTEDKNFKAYTTWFFSCVPEVKTSVVKSEDTPGASTVTLRVDSIDFQIGCPVKIWISKEAKPEVREHEKGHVEICKRLYDRSEAVVREIGEALVGQTYYGMGADLAEAERTTRARILGDLSVRFRERTPAQCEEVSSRFDRLTEKHMGDKEWTVDKLVKQSFADTVDNAVVTIKGGKESGK